MMVTIFFFISKGRINLRHKHELFDEWKWKSTLKKSSALYVSKNPWNKDQLFFMYLKKVTVWQNKVNLGHIFILNLYFELLIKMSIENLSLYYIWLFPYKLPIFFLDKISFKAIVPLLWKTFTCSWLGTHVETRYKRSTHILLVLYLKLIRFNLYFTFVKSFGNQSACKCRLFK